MEGRSFYHFDGVLQKVIVEIFVEVEEHVHEHCFQVELQKDFQGVSPFIRQNGSPIWVGAYLLIVKFWLEC